MDKLRKINRRDPLGVRRAQTGFIQLPRTVWHKIKRKGLTRTAERLLLTILDQCISWDRFWVRCSYADLADLAGVSVRSVERTVPMLAMYGLIEVGRCNRRDRAYGPGGILRKILAKHYLRRAMKARVDKSNSFFGYLRQNVGDFTKLDLLYKNITKWAGKESRDVHNVSAKAPPD